MLICVVNWEFTTQGVARPRSARTSEGAAGEGRVSVHAPKDADTDFDLDLLVATPQGQNRFYDNGIAAPRTGEAT